MANVNTSDSRPSLVKVPQNYPMIPTPGKVSILFDANEHDIYHKFDATDYDNGKGFGASQPYIYRYPDEPSNGILQTFGLQSRTDDVVRVTKFVASGRGVLFIAKQFLLQGYQPFDETNIYNPTEVILSATSNLTSGILSAPTRHLDTSGGLLGGLAALVGINVSRNSPPPSTVAAGNGQGGSTEGSLFGGFSLLGSVNNRVPEVMPVRNYNETAGLLRAKDANKARSILQTRWGADVSGQSGGIFSFVKGLAKSMFPQVFGSDKQNYKQRADELAYDWMITYYNNNTAKNQLPGTSVGGLSIDLFGIKLKNPITTRTSSPLTSATITLFKQKYFNKTEGGSYIYNKDEVTVRGDEEESNVKKIFDKFITQDGSFNNASDPTSPAAVVNESLKKVISNIASSGIYTTNITNNDNWLLPSGNSSKQGYNRLHDIASTPSNMKNNPNSVESVYYNNDVRTLDSIINPNKNVGLAGNNRPDKINTIPIIGINKKILVNPLNDDGTVKRTQPIAGSNEGSSVKQEPLLAGYEEWNPYEDDLIAFFFYDVVNSKYIPFRATVKGISESNNALWDELRFIGRADALYSYTGFVRTLSFSFTVVVNSLVELWPVWKRLNYLASSVKPSGYTKKVQSDFITNRFVIPPMFMLTIGDLYKYQPIVLTTINLNVPESAIWETVPENSPDEWTYMAKMIKSTVNKARIGQMPREVDVSITCNLLEKERPFVGGNHFGHAPFRDADTAGHSAVFNIVENSPYLPAPNKFSENLKEIKQADY